MGGILKAAFVAVPLSLVLFLMAMLITGSSGVATALATLPIVTITQIAEVLEGRRGGGKSKLDSMSENLSKDGYAISWKIVLPVSVIVIAAAPELGSYVGGLISGALLGPMYLAKSIDNYKASWATGSIIVTLVVCYFCGRWIGARCLRYGLLIAIVAPILSAPTVRLFDMEFSMPRVYDSLYGHGQVLPTFVRFSFGSWVTFFPLTLVGFLRGRSQQLSEYMRYLVRVLPADRRDALVSLVREAKT